MGANRVTVAAILVPLAPLLSNSYRKTVASVWIIGGYLCDLLALRSRSVRLRPTEATVDSDGEDNQGALNGSLDERRYQH